MNDFVVKAEVVILSFRDKSFVADLNRTDNTSLTSKLFFVKSKMS